MEEINITDLIRTTREQQSKIDPGGWTQKHLAQKIDAHLESLGKPLCDLSQSYISRIEKGETLTIHLDAWEAWLAVLQISPWKKWHTRLNLHSNPNDFLTIIQEMRSHLEWPPQELSKKIDRYLLDTERGGIVHPPLGLSIQEVIQIENGQKTRLNLQGWEAWKSVLSSALEEQIPTPVVTPSPSVKSIFYVPFSSLKEQFVGRTKELNKLKALMQEDPTPKVVIRGLRGIGKTQLALEYLHRNRDQYQHILWFDGSRSLEEQRKQIAIRYLQAPEEQAEVLFDQWWEAHRAQTLVCCDNLETALQSKIKDFQHPVRGPLLVTTPEKISALAPFRSLVLKNVDATAALKIFRQNYNHEPMPQEQLDQAASIVRHLGFHPLAIEYLARSLACRPSATLHKANERLLSLRLSPIDFSGTLDLRNETELLDIFEFDFESHHKDILVYLSGCRSMQAIKKEWPVQIFSNPEEPDIETEMERLLDPLIREGLLYEDNQGHIFIHRLVKLAVYTKVYPNYSVKGILEIMEQGALWLKNIEHPPEELKNV